MNTDWESGMAGALRRHAAESEIAREEPAPLGIRMVVKGDMAMPNGAVAEVRSIRFIERGKRMARFVTA